MTAAEEHSAEVPITNPMGFHVRPVQRFAELARAFRSEVTVQMRGRTVPGTSVMNLVSLGGRCGDTIKISARGKDARQCVAVLQFLAESSFFVEDHLQERLAPDRHVLRLSTMASCFDSEIRVTLNGQTVDAKSPDRLAQLHLSPTSVPTFAISGVDAQQAQAVLENLVAACFYVEDKMAERGRKAT